MVPETITGQRRSRSSKSVSSAKIAALALSVSKIVSTSSRSAPPSTRPAACSAYAATSSSKLVLRKPGSLTSGEIDAVRLVGPSPPATKRGRDGSVLGDGVGRLARQPCGLVVQLVGEVLHAVVGLGDPLRAEGVGRDDVGAGLEVLAVDRPDDVGLGEAEQVAVAAHVAVPVGEALAAVAALVEPVPLDHRAHGPVDDEDALCQQLGQRARWRPGAPTRAARCCWRCSQMHSGV